LAHRYLPGAFFSLLDNAHQRSCTESKFISPRLNLQFKPIRLMATPVSKASEFYAGTFSILERLTQQAVAPSKYLTSALHFSNVHAGSLCLF